jgi:tellurite methyltransferase
MTTQPSNPQHALASAHAAWERAWTSLAEQPDKPSRWRVAEPAVTALLPVLRSAGVQQVLDLGSGLGRHTEFLAASGFDTAALDASPRAVKETFGRLRQHDLHARVVRASFLHLPYRDEAFDYVLAWNVLYHGDSGTVRRSVAEIRRVLRPGGLYQGTMLSQRHRRYGEGTEVSPGAFVVPGARDDKIHPHYYCAARELMRLHDGLEPLTLTDVDQAADDPARPGAYHWEFVLEKKG